MAFSATNPPITEAKQFKDTPAGWAARWQLEMGAAERDTEKFRSRGDKINKIYLDERDEKSSDVRVNLFTSNVDTLMALLFGNVPSVEASRRYADASDDVARVSGEILERILTNDLERNSDSFKDAVLSALQDRLIPGLGVVRVRYEADFEEREEPVIDPVTRQPTGATVTKQVKTWEDACADYVHWRDFRWSPARTWADVRWVAFRALQTKDDLVKRFGPEIAEKVPLNAKRAKRTTEKADEADPWSRAEVWEIWDKDTRRVYWWVDGFDKCLDIKDDPLGLTNFWPMPKPMIAHATTTSMVPRADYSITQDQYEEINELSTRISLLQGAIRVAGLYDKGSPEAANLLSKRTENKLYPVDSWAAWAETGGIKGHIDWLPLEQIVLAIDKLREYRNELIQLLFQVSGFSDIMRGQATGPATATEQAIKARFSSVRVQHFQNEFARFVGEIQQLKGEIVAQWFDPQTIAQRSNMMQTPDAQLVPKAIELLKSDYSLYRVSVKPESISLTDYAALKQERVEALGALSQFMGGMQPVLQIVPGSLPYLLELAKWTIAGFRGSSTMEGIFDRAIDGATNNPGAVQPQQKGPKGPDPRAEEAKMKGQAQIIQMKGQMDAQNTMLKHKADLAKVQAEAQSATQTQAAQAQFNIQEMMAKMRAQGVLEAQKAMQNAQPGPPIQGPPPGQLP
jgi:hypothetical protein